MLHHFFSTEATPTGREATAAAPAAVRATVGTFLGAVFAQWILRKTQSPELADAGSQVAAQSIDLGLAGLFAALTGLGTLIRKKAQGTPLLPE